MTPAALKSLLDEAAAGSGAGVWAIYPQGSPGLSISFTGAGGSSEPTFDTAGRQTLRIQVDVRSATSAEQAWALRDQISAFLDNNTFVLTDGTIADVWLIQPLDGFENDSRQYRAGAEFTFSF